MSKTIFMSESAGPGPKPSPDVLWQRFDDEVVLVHLRTDRFLSLNRTGARFWELLVSGMDLGSIREELAKEFEVAPAELETEVARILASLRDEQLIVS